MHKHVLILLLVLASAAVRGMPEWLNVAKDGTFRMETAVFRVVHFGTGHALSYPESGEWKKEENSTVYRGRLAGGNFSASLISSANDRLCYRAEFSSTTPVKTLGLMLVFRISDAERTLTIDGKEFPLSFPSDPAKGAGEVIPKRKCKQIVLPLDSGSLLTISGKTELKVMNSRDGRPDPIEIRLYFQPSSGMLTRSGTDWNFSLRKILSNPVDISDVVNMGFRDDVAGDGKGGWTDQGPGNDLRAFQEKTVAAGGSIFRITDPEKNAGKSVIVLGRTFPREVTLPVSGRGRYLQLLHATGWTVPGTAGEITVTFADGSSQKIEVVSFRDVGNWWDPSNYPNGAVIWHGKNRLANLGLYVSQFRLDREDPVRLVLRAFDRQLWLIPGITLASGPVPNRGEDRTVVIRENREWIRLDSPRTIQAGSPLDFSGMLDAPAGKYGRITVAPDGHFSFEKAPEKRIRFVGVNLCNKAQFLTHEESDALAERLARLGYNAIRIHHHDNWLVKKDAPDSLTLDMEMLDHLEYLFAACRKRGIYITTDVFVSRKLKAGDRIPEWIPGGRGYQMKALLPISRAAMENWKEFARRWLTHRNPYTGMTWAEDPALYLVSFTNENNLYAKLAEEPGIAEQYRKLFGKWMKQNRPGEKAGEAALQNRHFLEFLYTLQHQSILEQAKFLKEELGLQALRTDVNMHNKTPLALIRRDLDAVDDHKYHDHPRFPINRWKLPGLYRQRSGIASLGNEVPEQLFAPRLFGKPFSITEYKFCAPNRFRSEGGPMIGGYAALQGWDALYQFAWAHSDRAVNTDLQIGTFDFANEPLAQLSDRLVMFLFRRGDVSASESRFAWNVPGNFWNTNLPEECPVDFSRLGLIAGIGTAVDGKTMPGVTLLSFDEAAGKAPLPDAKIQTLRRTLSESGVATSSTGQLRLDSRKNTLAIRTPRTLSATLASGTLEAGGLTVSGIASPTTVSVSSLNAEPVSRSTQLLLFHLTDVLDSGTTFKGERRQYLLRWGKLPHLVLRSPAEIALRLDGNSRPEVKALRLDGSVYGKVASRFSNGILRFTADPGLFRGGVMVYWITRDPGSRK